MISKSAILSVLVFGFFFQTFAAIIGTNVSESPLSSGRIAALPVQQQPVWTDYLNRSTAQMQADRDFFRMEMKSHGVKNTTNAPATRSFKGLPLDRATAWYRGDEARRVAAIVVSFQTPAGGWSKNLDMTKHLRAPGEFFTSDNNSRFGGQPDDYDSPHDMNWSYVGTIDNGATITQLRFLAKVIAANPTNSAAFHSSFMHGLDYLFAAQFPDGGWPQVWPLQGGYHDAITFNDDAMLNVLTLLRDVASGTNEFAFATADTRARAAASLKRGIDCIIATQIVTNGRRTIWCQQHDELTLKPSSARNYEMPSQSAAESAAIVLFLMQLPKPDSNVVAAVHAACAWFEKTRIEGKAYKLVKSKGRELIDASGSTIWARCYEIGSDRPIFGERDKSIHDDVSEISLERRNGYGWYRDTPKRALEHYARWSKVHPK